MEVPVQGLRCHDVDVRAELIADLERRTGVSIVRLEIGKVDLLRDTANLKIHFSGDKEPGHFEEQQG